MSKWRPVGDVVTARRGEIVMALPLWDENPFKTPIKPWVSWSIILLNIAVFFFQYGHTADFAYAVAVGFGATPSAVLHISDIAVQTQHDGSGGWLPPELTIITSLFLHGDFTHLIGNMLFLFVFGDNVELTIGHKRFFFYYLLCGIVATLVHVASSPDSTAPLIGASGAIAGVVVAYAMTRPCAKITVLIGIIPLRVRAFWVIGAWGIWQIWQVIPSSQEVGDNTAYWAHIGGLLAGLVLFPLIKPAGVKLFECVSPDSFRPPPAPQPVLTETRGAE
jgi:membrane associated rhomboid family serine protease